MLLQVVGKAPDGVSVAVLPSTSHRSPRAAWLANTTVCVWGCVHVTDVCNTCLTSWGVSRGPWCGQGEMAVGPTAFHPSLGWSSNVNEEWTGWASSHIDQWCALKQDVCPIGSRVSGTEIPLGVCNGNHQYKPNLPLFKRSVSFKYKRYVLIDVLFLSCTQNTRGTFTEGIKIRVKI